MLDFLERIKIKRTVAESSIEHSQPGEGDLSDIRQKLIDSFQRSNNYKGTSLPQYSVKCLSQLAKHKEISQGAFFIADNTGSRKVLRFVSGFASPKTCDLQNILELGEGFPGQVAKDRRIMNISGIPEGYLMIESGLGKAAPVSLIIFPVVHQDEVLAVIELSSFHRFSSDDEHFFNAISPSIAEQILKCRNQSE